MEKAKSLHKQFLIADRARLHLIEATEKYVLFSTGSGITKTLLRLKWKFLAERWRRPFYVSPSNEALMLLLFQDSLLYLNLFYGLLYSVIEGWQDAGFSDPAVDGLLQDEPKLSKLRLLRNATFHVQNEYISEKTLKFLEEPETETWAKEVHTAIGKTLLQRHASYLQDFKSKFDTHHRD